MKTSSKILLSGLIGAAAGAVAGILFAPDKGKKTRAQIAKSAEDVKKSVSEFAEASKEAVEDMVKNGREKLNV